jgi:hypothetical protein
VVSGATGGPVLVATTLAEKGAYVVIITAAPLRPEHQQMIDTSMAEAVARFEEADDIPEETEGDLYEAIPEKEAEGPSHEMAATQWGQRTLEETI